MRLIVPCLIVNFAAAVPAEAADVNLTANLTPSCVLTSGATGVMTADVTGTRLASVNNGGSAATLSVVAIGSLPTLSFSAPSLAVSPAGWSATPTLEIKYSSLGGASQDFTSAASTATLGALNDSFTVDGRVTSTTGFASGSYQLRTVVTCSQ